MNNELIIKVDKFFMCTNLLCAIVLALLGDALCFFNLIVAFVCWLQYTWLEKQNVQ